MRAGFVGAVDPPVTVCFRTLAIRRPAPKRNDGLQPGWGVSSCEKLY